MVVCVGFVTATVQIPLTLVIERILYGISSEVLPTVPDLLHLLQMHQVGEREGVRLADVENATKLLVSEGRIWRVIAGEKSYHQWPVNRQPNLNFDL